MYPWLVAFQEEGMFVAICTMGAQAHGLGRKLIGLSKACGARYVVLYTTSGMDSA